MNGWHGSDSSYKRHLVRQPCANCGHKPDVDSTRGERDTSRRIEVDHVFPRARLRDAGLSRSDQIAMGADSPSNLQPLCRPCNEYKSAWTLEELRTRNFTEWHLDGTAQINSDGSVTHRPYGCPVPWPPNFDWNTDEWVDRVRTPDGTIEVRTPAAWVRGTLFDYPIRP